MRRLSPNLFDKRFDDLVEMGRSRLPSLAPRLKRQPHDEAGAAEPLVATSN